MRVRARLVWLVVLVAVGASLNGCRIFRHRQSQGCTEPQPTQDIASVPPLRVPEGLDPPNTRNGVKLPPLNEPEHVRAASEPCLSIPPSYAVSPPSGAAAPAVPAVPPR